MIIIGKVREDKKYDKCFLSYVKFRLYIPQMEKNK